MVNKYYQKAACTFFSACMRWKYVHDSVRFVFWLSNEANIECDAVTSRDITLGGRSALR